MKKTLVLGVDIGGTNTVMGLVDKSGNVTAEASMPTNNQENADKYFSRFLSFTKDFLGSYSDYELAGIGIGAPNANYYTGKVEEPPNLNWGTVNVAEIVAEQFPVKVKITNDANAAALGEMLFGTAKGMKDFIVITLGTGLGSGIVCNGDVLYGHDGFAGEAGHVIVVPDGRECGCGRKGCLETYASASGIKRTIAELLCNRACSSQLRDMPYKDITSKMIYDAALKADPIALEAFKVTGDILGRALANAVAFTSPEAIILFGGLALAGDLILNPTREAMNEHTLNIFKGKAKLMISQMQNGNTAVMGSAALIWKDM